jgi:hypothetical protein
MTRFVGTVLIAAALAAWAGAEGGAPVPSPVEQKELFHRNAALIEVLVEGGVGLTEEPGPFDRADRCRKLVERLATEVGAAAEAREPARLTELSGHLRRLVEEGLLPNLQIARQQASVGSPQERQLFHLRDQFEQTFQELAEKLQQDGGREGRSALESFAEVRERVKDAVKPLPQ